MLHESVVSSLEPSDTHKQHTAIVCLLYRAQTDAICDPYEIRVQTMPCVYFHAVYFAISMRHEPLAFTGYVVIDTGAVQYKHYSPMT